MVFDEVRRILQQGHLVPKEIVLIKRKMGKVLRATPVELTIAEAHDFWALTRPYLLSLKRVRAQLQQKFPEEVFE